MEKVRRIFRNIVLSIFVAFILVNAASAREYSAGEIAEMRQNLLIPIPEELENLGDQIFPSSSISCPTGGGLYWRDFSVGLSYVASTPISLDPDGGIVGSVGFGSPSIVGVDVSGYSSALIRRSSHGALSVNVHRPFFWGVSAAVGIDSVFKWGASDVRRSEYLALSKSFALQDSPYKYFSLLTINVGVGRGRFLTDEEYVKESGGIYPFLSVGLLVARPLSIILDWSAGSLNAGLSLIPIPRAPIIINVSVLGLVRGSFGNYTSYSSSAGLSFRL